MKPNIDTDSLVFKMAQELMSKEVKAALEIEMKVVSASPKFGRLKLEGKFYNH